jgi:zinc transporter ZupT
VTAGGPTAPARNAWLWAVVPLLLLAGLIWLFLATDPLGPLGVSAPPVEEITVERVTLDDAGIHLSVRADGSEPVSIAQVQIDGAYWTFTQDPPGELGRLQRARIDIPYPWVQDETHAITLLSRNGVPFEHEIAVATTTPRADLGRLLAFALLGIYVGVVPVTLGLLFYPFLRTLGQRGLQFLLALTVGLLAFLLIDTLQEGLELAAGAAGAFQAGAVVWLAAGLSFLTLLVIGRRRGVPEGLALATFLALGIGLHNLGEGLAIGAAFAVGEAALGSFLVVGFTLHNITEGIGIAAPLTARRPPLLAFLALAALAGLPAVAGTWIGAFAFAPQWAALFLGIGAGAILQVIIEVGSYLNRSARAHEGSWLSASNLLGFAAGLALMYGTAFFVNV